MKLFAKRTKKAISAEDAAQLALISEADKAALELLKKDQSTLNAKQRRMIKRYEERKEESAINEPASGDIVGSKLSDGDYLTSKEAAITETSPEASGKMGVDREESIESNVTNSDDSDNERHNACEDETIPPETKKGIIEKSKNLVSGTPHAVKKVDVKGETSKKIPPNDDQLDEEEIKKLVASLNSKYRRKLTRQLEREGPSAFAAVKEEALRLADEGKPVEVIPPEPEPKGKKRKVDWSSLTPEERLRRQDQTRKQEEAAERRSKGIVESSAHKHTLNSERRRANRRKPKWQRMGAVINTHDTSGFQMRKTTKSS